MLQSLKTGLINTQVVENIATITFTHPASNALPLAMLNSLATEILRLNNLKNVFVIIIKSKGKTFCAGASFDELLEIKTLEEGVNFFSGFANLINNIRICSKLIIASVQGKTVGGGVGLIAACDYVIATPNSDVKLSEISIGIGPFVIEPVITKKIGKNAMLQMTFESEWKPANWSKDKGLFDQIVAPEILDETVLKWAQKMAAYNTKSVKEIKKIAWENTSHWKTLLYERAAISGQLILSPQAKTIINDFKTKKNIF